MKTCPYCAETIQDAAVVCRHCKSNLTGVGEPLGVPPVQTARSSDASVTDQGMMSFSTAIGVCLGKYATFAGRATRAEFWWFSLFTLLMSWGASIVGVAVFGEGGGAFNLLPTLVFFLPSLAVMVRRFHDTGRSGWNYWWCLTIIGVIPVFIWLASEGDRKENRYGPPYRT